MKNIFLFGLIALILVSGCTGQVQEEPSEELETPLEQPAPRPIAPRVPTAPDISAEGEIKEINYIYTSSPYGGFIESIDFDVTNTGEKSIVIGVDYVIADLSEDDVDLMVILDEVGGGIIPVGNIEEGETESFTLSVPKKRIRTGHIYKIKLTINDTISKEELAVIEKTQELPCRGDC